MLIKLIDCVPLQNSKDEFSKSQELWSEISTCDGLRAQFGGWDKKSSHAIVLALWENQSSIDLFMRQKHDIVEEKTGQRSTYERCTVSLLVIEMTIPEKFNNAILDVSKIGFTRIADCYLYSGGKKQFIDDQKNIWNPGMAECQGMLGGYVASFTKEKDRFLVVSFWDSEVSHQRYIADQFPLLRNKVEINSYIKELTGYQIVLNKKWDIIPNQTLLQMNGKT
jgi:heme-degrading monooxygenase HmoA